MHVWRQSVSYIQRYQSKRFCLIPKRNSILLHLSYNAKWTFWFIGLQWQTEESIKKNIIKFKDNILIRITAVILGALSNYDLLNQSRCFYQRQLLLYAFYILTFRRKRSRHNLCIPLTVKNLTLHKRPQLMIDLQVLHFNFPYVYWSQGLKWYVNLYRFI